MKTTRFALLCISLMCAPLAHATSWLATQLSYQAEGWNIGQVYGLNNQGQVIGRMEPPGPPPSPGIFESVPMGFVTGANGKNLQPVDPNYTPYIEYCHGCHTAFTPRAINNAGQVAVTTFSPWSQEVSILLSGPGGGAITPPAGIIGAWGAIVNLNNSGQIAAHAHGPPASFVTDANGSNPHLLAMFDNNYDSTISGINDNGQLLITGVRAGTTDTKTFVTGPNASDVAFEVDNFGHSSFVTGLNNSAQLFGSYYAAAGGQQRGFITDANGTNFTDIGDLGGQTFISGISNTGLAVGSSAGKAFIYGLNGSGIRDLNSLIALGSGEYLNHAVDINDRGQVVAESNLGKMYLLTPVPEPSVYLMFAGGLALILWQSQRQTAVSRETGLAA